MEITSALQQRKKQKLVRGTGRFLTRLLNWEFWPLYVVYAPVFFYYVVLSVRARHPFYFSLANPGMKSGGFFGPSKYSQMRTLPTKTIPRTCYFNPPVKYTEVIKAAQKEGIDFPVIIKPDFAGRGVGVEKVSSKNELQQLIKSYHAPFLLQEYIDLPFEAGVFYYRMPGEKKGHISSVVIKDFLSVTGNGKSTIEDLMEQNTRARLVLDGVRKRLGDYIYKVPAKDEKVLLEPIGNHNRGTAFLDGNYLINSRMVALFDQLSRSLDGFYYGRFDIRAPDANSLYSGKNLKIMEVNGASAEPAHIYQPGSSLLSAWRNLFFHWHVMFKISHINRKNGIRPANTKEMYHAFIRWRNARSF